MTEERLERNRVNSKRLNQIVVWSLTNSRQWLRICYGDTEGGIGTHHLSALLDECLHQGFMEIYYLILNMVADAVGVDIRMDEFIKFLEASIDKNLTLDVAEIRKTQIKMQ